MIIIKDIIINRLEKAIKNLDSENFEELFSLILTDLEYILKGYYEDYEKLSDKEQFMSGPEFSNKKNIYFAKLAKIYFKLMFNKKINIVCSNDYNLSIAGGGYNSNDGNIYYSQFGALLSSKTDLSFLHMCLHEGRHKIQNETYKIENPLLFPPYMLKELREVLLERSLPNENRKFYTDNYYILFAENDAEYFAKNNIYNFISNITLMYSKITGKSLDEINYLFPQIKKVENLLNAILEKEKFNINTEIAEQLYSSFAPTGEYELDGQQVDKIVIADKFIKSHPELQEKYPILKLLFEGNNVKNYEQIIHDRNNIKSNLNQSEQKRIDKLYDEIIRLDPILMLTDLLEKEDRKACKDFINLHPLILEEYSLEIEKLNEKYGQFYTYTK